MRAHGLRDGDRSLSREPRLVLFARSLICSTYRVRSKYAWILAGAGDGASRKKGELACPNGASYRDGVTFLAACCFACLFVLPACLSFLPACFVLPARLLLQTLGCPAGPYGVIIPLLQPSPLRLDESRTHGQAEATPLPAAAVVVSAPSNTTTTAAAPRTADGGSSMSPGATSRSNLTALRSRGIGAADQQPYLQSNLVRSNPYSVLRSPSVHTYTSPRGPELCSSLSDSAAPPTCPCWSCGCAIGLNRASGKVALQSSTRPLWRV